MGKIKKPWTVIAGGIKHTIQYAEVTLTDRPDQFNHPEVRVRVTWHQWGEDRKAMLLFTAQRNAMAYYEDLIGNPGAPAKGWTDTTMRWSHCYSLSYKPSWGGLTRGRLTLDTGGCTPALSELDKVAQRILKRCHEWLSDQGRQAYALGYQASASPCELQQFVTALEHFGVPVTKLYRNAYGDDLMLYEVKDSGANERWAQEQRLAEEKAGEETDEEANERLANGAPSLEECRFKESN